MVPQQTRDISVGLAALPLVTMLVLFTLGAAVMDMGTELLVLVMLGAAAVASIVAVRVGCSWDDIQRSTGEKLAQVLPAVLILLTIGMLIGTWVVGGTIPMLVYYGLKIVNPSFFVVTAFLATSVMSICTGTSWGSAGTIGVALMGMGVALGAPLGPTAGAVVSGAYFGDKLSPLSDSTNICAIGAGANLYAHIRMMLYTAIPSFILATLVYTFAVRTPAGDGGLPESAQILLADIETIYSLSILTALPVLVVIIGIARRTPPVVAMVTSSVVAAILGIVLQGFSVESALLSMVGGFDLGMVADKGIDPGSLGTAAATLLARGGLYCSPAPWTCRAHSTD
jgi:NhaC family Na+:H+ antiporter